MKQIKIQLIQRHEHEHKHGFISWIYEQPLPLTSGTEQSDSTLTPLFPHHQNPGGLTHEIISCQVPQKNLD